ncbi:hypothetical protein BaRGS_00022816 [Batillaria attramentaria]|uniref:Uncharacterized protein n=1 Tax=Batillaria attramentaria TaxID=370345 RepID=A0ABD0KG54_9CAEN
MKSFTSLVSRADDSRMRSRQDLKPMKHFLIAVGEEEKKNLIRRLRLSLDDLDLGHEKVTPATGSLHRSRL